MAETIVLDASGIAVNRTQLDITNWVSATNSPNWGDAEITAFMADQAVGSSPVDYRLPNRQISIPLNLKSISGGASFASIRQSLQAKVGLLQREGGWIMRTSSTGTALYADVVNATLHLGGAWLQAYRDIDVDAVLSLECVPDWYADETTLTTHTETVLPRLLFTETTLNGNYPSRVRIVATNGTSVDQHGLLWGVRSKHYDAGTTAALFYEAEKLVPLSGAAGTALSGASGGSAVTHSTLPANAWVPILSTNMLSGTVPLTHTGSYRVWGRCYSATALPQYRFQWGAGGLSVPTTNDPIQVPGTAAFYMLDLGSIRIDAPPTGVNQWVGVVQAQVTTANNPASIDALFFQPLDDGAGKLTYTKVSPASSIQAVASPGTATNDSGTGSTTWTASTSTSTCALGISGVSEYLKLTGLGFAVPTGATIIGIIASIVRQSSPFGGSLVDNRVRLVKAGTVQTTDRAVATSWPGSPTTQTYGGATDLWGASWAASDINNSGFGFAISVNNLFPGTVTASVSSVQITILFTLASGFTVAPDAVLAASGTAELRTDGMYRQGGGGTIFAAVSNVTGDLPRVPPSGLESRTCEFFLKMTRGNFADEADSGIDDMSAKLIYRPSYLYTT